MGIKNFIKYVEKNAKNALIYSSIDKYKNKTIGIDTNLLIYQLVYAIRKHGYDIKKGNKIVTHIHALNLKLKAFVRFNIKAIFVFDSGYPDIKRGTLEKRTEIKKKLIEKYKNDKTDKGKRIYYYIKTNITQKEINDCKELIKIFGYPIIDAKEEADSQLAYLYKNKLIDYIVSNDMDILLFGGGKILKNFSIDPKKTIIEINLKVLLKELNMDQTQLIKLGMQLGCDYCEPVKNNKFNKTKIKIVINYFINPPILEIKKNELQFNKIDKKELQKFLIKNGYKN
jgi:flap endonuclease-1